MQKQVNSMGGLRLTFKRTIIISLFLIQFLTHLRCFNSHSSQVPVPDLFLCFGSRSPDGYGVCYNPQEKHIIISVACFHSCPDTNSILFLKGICEAMLEIRDILLDSSDMLKDSAAS